MYRYVDLGAVYVVDTVLIVPRLDGWAIELGSIEVRIGNAPINATSPPNKNGNTVCGGMLTGAAGTYAPVMATGCNLVGRYVSVQRVGVLASATNPYLTLCEVQVRCRGISMCRQHVCLTQIKFLNSCPPTYTHTYTFAWSMPHLGIQYELLDGGWIACNTT